LEVAKLPTVALKLTGEVAEGAASASVAGWDEDAPAVVPAVVPAVAGAKLTVKLCESKDNVPTVAGASRDSSVSRDKRRRMVSP
jgi:hypothetical protein